MIGDKNGMYRQIIKDNLYAALIGILSFFLGGICIAVSLYLKSEKTKKYAEHSGIWDYMF